jgi:hypothetical protein
VWVQEVQAEAILKHKQAQFPSHEQCVCSNNIVCELPRRAALDNESGAQFQSVFQSIRRQASLETHAF